MFEEVQAVLGKSSQILTELQVRIEPLPCRQPLTASRSIPAARNSSARSILSDHCPRRGSSLRSGQAMSNPNTESEEAAWNAVLPAVDQLKKFYDFSNELRAALSHSTLSLSPWSLGL